MGSLVVRGAIMGRKPLGNPEPGKPQFFAWFIKDVETGEQTEVLSSDVLGGPGEITDIPVDVKVATRRDGSFMDRVKFYAKSAERAAMETTWDAPAPQQLKPGVAAALNPPTPSADQSRMAAAMNGNKS